jgi:hypothetical protein
MFSMEGWRLLSWSLKSFVEASEKIFEPKKFDFLAEKSFCFWPLKMCIGIRVKIWNPDSKISI